MFKTLNKSLSIVLIISIFQSSYAQEAPEDDAGDLFSMSLEELMNVKVVSASKREESVFDAASNITVITEKMIKEWGARDIKDIMRRVSGYQVIADRDEWVFAARGNVSDNNAKYLILVDGHRTNSIENFGPGQIIEVPNNLSNVKQIEVIKGPGSAVWGADALAGVINIITKDYKDLGGHKANASLTYGSDNLIVGDFQVGNKISDVGSFVVMGSFSAQDGKKIEQTAASGLSITNGTSIVENGNEQINTILDNHKFGYMLQMKAHVDKFRINAYTFETETFNRHYEYGLGRKNYLTTNKTFVEAQYQSTFWYDGTITAKIATESNYAEYRPEKQGSADKLPINISWRDRGVMGSVEMNKRFEKVSIYSGLDYKFMKAGPNHRLNGFNPDDPLQQQYMLDLAFESPVTDTTLSVNRLGYWFDRYLEDHQFGGYFMADFNPIEQLSITLGGRADYNEQRGTDAFVFNPRAAIIVKPVQKTALKLLYNRGYLRPVNFQSASPNVASEIMNQFDAIWMHQVGPVQYTVTGYWQKLEGFINIAEGFGFSNTGDYTSIGVEVDVKATINEQLTIWGNASISNPEGENFKEGLAYNNQRVDLDGQLLSFAPFTANGGITFRLLDDNKLFISPAIRVVGPTTYRVGSAADKAGDSEANYRETDLFPFVDLSVGYEPTDKLGFYVAVDNLTDITDPTHMTIWNGTIEQYGMFVTGRVKIHF